ncbi:competence protein ComQ [Paenibacillus forsythiae]|uniref:Competence protein ComQ n=1 Tax=Paenibacillus forsythiae TaxID=365616 RepID=A0ABU3HBH4_9BACL|nr:polyprenyl synthetase family protein [Paenibacillus forsythiae]MDT3428167.1 competence protein ComQ [Paenibacillus forsythiae]
MGARIDIIDESLSHSLTEMGDRMEDLAESVAKEIRGGVQTYFALPHLYEQATACVDEKLRGSLPFARLTVLHYRAFGGRGPAIYRAAGAIELMILGADIVDDLQDKDNNLTAWSRMSPEIALNIALGLTLISGQMLLASEFPLERIHEAVQYMNTQSLTAINGQTADLLNDIQSEEDYLRMIKQKSAAFVVAACMIGTLLATGEWNSHVRDYAEELGIADQIKNDIRDLLDWERGDFRNRKKTLSTLYLLQYIAEEDQWIADYFEGRLRMEEIGHRREEFERAVERTGTFLYTSVRMRMHCYNYLRIVDKLNIDVQWKNRIIALAK